MPSARLRWIGCVALAAELSACGRFKKAKECEILAGAVSTWLAKQPPPSSARVEPKVLAAEARATAKRYEGLDHDLGALPIKNIDLVPRVARYRELATKSAHALSEVADALERGDAELARRRRVEFDATARAEAPLVAEINATCRR
jgi:hypothetical protein